MRLQDLFYYIDDGPYLHSMEHLIEHYMTIPDGLPCILQTPVPPKPNPPLPSSPHPSLVRTYIIYFILYSTFISGNNFFFLVRYFTKVVLQEKSKSQLSGCIRFF